MSDPDPDDFGRLEWLVKELVELQNEDGIGERTRLARAMSSILLFLVVNFPELKTAHAMVERLQQLATVLEGADHGTRHPLLVVASPCNRPPTAEAKKTFQGMILLAYDVLTGSTPLEILLTEGPYSRKDAFAEIRRTSDGFDLTNVGSLYRWRADLCAMEDYFHREWKHDVDAEARDSAAPKLRDGDPGRERSTRSIAYYETLKLLARGIGADSLPTNRRKLAREIIRRADYELDVFWSGKSR